MRLARNYELLNPVIINSFYMTFIAHSCLPSFMIILHDTIIRSCSHTGIINKFNVWFDVCLNKLNIFGGSHAHIVCTLCTGYSTNLAQLNPLGPFG